MSVAEMMRAPAHELFQIAVTKADEARDIATANKSWAEKHDAVCELRQGQLRADIHSLQQTVRWATTSLLTGLGGLIVTLLLLIFRVQHVL